MYPTMNGTLAGNSVMYFFTYANDVTHQLAVPLVVLSFFLVLILGSSFMQIRTTGRLRFETSFLASCFVTLIFATIFETVTGLLSPIYFILLVLATILGFIWVAMSE